MRSMSVAAVLFLTIVFFGGKAAASGFGSAVAGGDFNGANEAYSAWDEMVVGAPWQPSSTGAANAGAVYVYVRTGDPIFDGLNRFTPSAWQVFAITQSSFGASDGGNEAQDLFGSVFAIGDFNGDGKQDLAIGVPMEDLPNATNAGCVHVLFGANNPGTKWPFRAEKAYLTENTSHGQLCGGCSTTLPPPF